MKKRFLLKGFFAVSAASVCMSIDGLKNATNMATAAVDLDQTTATIQQDPAITILTHALGGNPSFWSNDFNIDSNGDYHDITGFCYDPNSLIEKIHNYFGSDFALYLVEHKDKDTEMEIKHCIFDYGTNDYTYETVEKIENFPRHTVVVPNLTTDYSLEELDGCFTNIINKLQNDYYEDKGCHTRINFIGHSMGGLINMQYVIQHPEFAASLISLGTPYNGTTYNNDFVKNVCGIDAFNQQCICGDCDHSWFFCDLERRREAWNEMYANNHQIKFLTCSGETSVDLIEKLVNNQEVAKYHSGISWAQTVASFVYPASVVLSGDFSVDFDSQGAPGFDGAIRFNKKFDANNSRIDKRCLNDMGVPHALEPYDEDMHKVILRTLGYQDPTKRSNSAHGINIELIGLSQQEMNAFYPDEHIVKITNNTGKARSLAYNKKLCFEGDAEEWSGLGDVELTDVLQNGESTLVSIQDNYAGDTITVSYAENNYRYIVYCSDLKLNDSYLHFKRGNEKIPNMTYTSSSGIGINIVSKYFTTPFATWYFEITNNTNKTRTFYYNDALCFKDDGLSWNNLSDIEEVVLKPGQTGLVSASENVFAGSFVISYVENNYRYIVCSNELSSNHSFTHYESCKEEDVSLRIVNFNDDTDTWTIKLTNKTGSTKRFYYNDKMCFEDDAKYWDGLEDVRYVDLSNGTSTDIEIAENVWATSIVVSYVDFANGIRHVYYANDLNKEYKTMDTYSYRTSFEWYRYSGVGMSVGIIGSYGNKWILQVRNDRTDSNTRFYYFENTTNVNNALMWNHIGNTERTIDIPRGQSKQIEVYEGSCDYLAISYLVGNTRYVFYADDLDTDGTMAVYGRQRDESIRAIITTKSNGYWNINIKNNSSTSKTFYYNTKMCNSGDAINWTGLSNVDYFTLGSGQSRKVLIQENGFATHISFCYIENFVRHIFYANELSENGGMSYSTNTKTISTYTANNIKVGIAGKKNGNTWLLCLANTSSTSRTFDYFPSMCNVAIAKGWNYLGSNNQPKSIYVAANTTLSTPIEVKENGTNGYISVSYKSGSYRYVYYTNGLSTSCTMNSPTSYSRDESIKVEVVSKSSGTWTIRLTNNTGAARTFYYNKKMCFEGDGRSFTGLSDVAYVYVSSGSSTTLNISENGTAGYISLCYLVGNTKYVFYANNLSTDGGMIGYRATSSLNAYNLNGMKVSILGKDGSTWLFQVTNTSGSYQNIYYNSKLAFEGDASKWSGLSDVGSPVSLSNGATTTSPIRISENGMAGTMAISYIDSSNYRHIFYAYDLSTSGTMTAKSNTINLNASSDDNCVVAGTMITLADGTKKAVEDLTGDEMLLVWNFETGSYDYAPILFIDSDPEAFYNVIKLTFSDGTEVDVVTEHGFFDTTLNKYVYLDENADQYIGHNFIKCDGDSYTEVTLTDVTIETELTTTYSPVTYGHLCYYVNDMLSMPGGISGLFNYFDIDPTTMKYDEEAMANDIATYGLLTYEELCEFAPVSREMFDAVNGQYLKVALGKGLITLEDIEYLAERYSSFVPEEVEETATSEVSLREQVIELLDSYGLSIQDLVNYYVRSYTRVPWLRVTLTDANWDVTYNGTYYTIVVNAKVYGFNVTMSITIA